MIRTQLLLSNSHFVTHPPSPFMETVVQVNNPHFVIVHFSLPPILNRQIKNRARIFKRLRRPGNDVAWRAGTTNRVVVQARQAGNRFLGSLQGLQIRATAGPAGNRRVWYGNLEQK
jgi:hypothetical protein